MKEQAENNVAENDDNDKVSLAKTLLNSGSRNYLLKQYDLAADELSQVCSIYEELNGPLCDELGMPYLLYAKCLIFLAVEENKVLDVPAEEENSDSEVSDSEENPKQSNIDNNDDDSEVNTELKRENKKESDTAAHEDDKKDNHSLTAIQSSSVAGPSTSTGEVGNDDQQCEEETEATTNLQIAWEILELAAKIFSKQGLNGLSYLAEVHTELGNIEFENNILEGAREDYEKALLIYKELQIKTYRRAIAEVHYKIGLTFLIQESYQEGVGAFKVACDILNDEINDIKLKETLTQKDKDNIQDMEETKQEILEKITEIEETREQNIEKVRAALDKFISPVQKTPEKLDTTTDKQASTSGASVSKPNDISHLIKRKKSLEPSVEESSPAKRPAL